MPLIATRGAASAQGFGEFAQSAVVNYIEDVFSTYLRTGTSASATVVNGIDMSTYGGMIWMKARDTTANNILYDTARGAGKVLLSNTTGAQTTNLSGYDLTAFTTSGYTLGSPQSTSVNESPYNIVNWTFREQAKFFDIVTYTGNGALPNQLISHNLGSVPGCIIFKATNAARNWIVWHRGNGTTNYGGMSLNLITASGGSLSSGDLPTATQFKPGAFFDPDYNNANETGVTYVAYLFAHNAGGFGLTGSDNVITCGSYTGGTFNGVTYDAVTTTLGFEPQWLLIKEATGTNAWFIFDNMRGIVTGGNDPRLSPNSGNQEGSSNNWVDLTSTGFTATASDGSSGINNGSSYTYIYIAIRRGPMKVPTVGTTVFSPNVSSATTGTAVTTSFPIDLQIQDYRVTPNSNFVDKLRGFSSTSTESGTYLRSVNANAEASGAVSLKWNNTSFQITSAFSEADTVYYNFRRAPGFFDEVCYTGTGSATTITHNLGVAPELIIVKDRTIGWGWMVYSSGTGATKNLILNTTAAENVNASAWNNTAPTSSVFTVGTSSFVNTSSDNYVAYLFATCAGVSKVGSYSGNTGNIVTVNCGFTAGARFVLIKRTDSTGDWYVYDSARGISSGNDPYLLWNSNSSEVTGTNYVDTDTTGFKVTAAAPAGLNASGGTYIFLAIA
jgi:hypothetical protein